MTNLSNQIEALLFWKSEPVSLKELSKMLSTEEEKIDEALLELEKNLENRGIVLVKKDESVYLATSSESSELIKKITKEEESAELGKASLETLSIVLYKSPIRRSDIDYIRGVNSSFILRNLLVRGLIDKKTDPKDSRTFVYSPSFELLAHLGITEVAKLPDFEKVQTEIQAFREQKEKNNQTQ
ncbi:MAG: SMC-Scp complex subunit ScpB [bacterium]